MSDKGGKYIEAAIEVFSRYGVRKTTMGDIAERAGVSRQTLYASYANKDEVLAAAMDFVIAGTLRQIEAEWPECASLAEILDVYFEHAVIAYFEKIRTMPDSKDLLTGHNGSVKMTGVRSADAKRDALAAQLERYSGQLAKSGMTAVDLADFIKISSEGFNFVAADEAHLRRLLASLKSNVLALVGEGA